MKLEIRMNKEIRGYSEKIFFGLNLRETICSGVAIGASVMTYLGCISYLHVEVVSWLCILSALPFGLLGFFHYHEMTAEQLAALWLREHFLEPQVLFYRSSNLFYALKQEGEQYGNQNTAKNHKRAKKGKKTKKSTGSDTNKRYS